MIRPTLEYLPRNATVVLVRLHEGALSPAFGDRYAGVATLLLPDGETEPEIKGLMTRSLTARQAWGGVMRALIQLGATHAHWERHGTGSPGPRRMPVKLLRDA